MYLLENRDFSLWIFVMIWPCLIVRVCDGAGQSLAQTWWFWSILGFIAIGIVAVFVALYNVSWTNHSHWWKTRLKTCFKTAKVDVEKVDEEPDKISHDSKTIVQESPESYPQKPKATPLYVLPRHEELLQKHDSDSTFSSSSSPSLERASGDSSDSSSEFQTQYRDNHSLKRPSTSSAAKIGGQNENYPQKPKATPLYVLPRHQELLQKHESDSTFSSSSSPSLERASGDSPDSSSEFQTQYRDNHSLKRPSTSSAAKIGGQNERNPHKTEATFLDVQPRDPELPHQIESDRSQQSAPSLSTDSAISDSSESNSEPQRQIRENRFMGGRSSASLDKVNSEDCLPAAETRNIFQVA